MAKKRILSKAVEGIASLFKSKGKDVAEGVAKPEKVFAQNLIETFGEKEVDEAFRIIDNKYKNPELEKLFYKEGESKMDDLVNLLETRYMGSTRLQAHPLSFNRRGPGAADRYTRINDTGERLTDLPGGPGDSSLYGKNYGEMSETVIGGKKVYDTPPSIFEEGTRITDEGILIEGKAVQDSLYEKTIADMPLINRMMKETGKTETEIREAIADLANEGYQAGSPKRMSPFDDDRIRAFISNKETIPGDKEDFVTDMMEALGEGPISGQQKQIDNLIAGMTDESDAILQNMKKMEAEAKAMTEIARAEQTQMGEAVEAFNRMLDDGEDPAAALEFLKNAMKRTKQADGGRVGAKTGGLMALLKAMGMKAPDKIADKKQIENVIRDPKTELERRFKDDPVTGTPATPRNQPTIDEIRDMIQKDPRYNKLTRAQMDMVVRRETIRADFAYNMGIKPEEVGDDIVDLLLMEGYDQRFGFNMGGLIPPQRGPMSEGMGTLYRSK